MQKIILLKTVVYTSDKRTHFFKEILEIFRDIKKSNFLAFQIAKRDLQAQYRQSYLGFFWAFAPILANSLVWIFLKSSGTVNIKEPAIPYILFVVIGTTLWSVFLESLQMPISAVNSGKSILSKINFPKEALLMGGLYKMFFNLILKLLMIVGFLFFFKVIPSETIVYVPIYILTIIIFSTAIGVFMAPIGLLYSDVARIISMVSTFLMYATPVVYMAPQFGFFKTIFNINPLTHLLNDTRNALTGLEVYSLNYTFILLIISTILLLVGLVIFRKSMPILIEKIS